jgi:eukaryotic-like serine/threonine-protein kinase
LRSRCSGCSTSSSPGRYAIWITDYRQVRHHQQGRQGQHRDACYLSHDPYYGRDVAIKLYNIEEDDDADRARVTRKMFFNEAHMVGKLQHPNIMPIYDAGEENGKYYVVTEHMHGARTLSSYCKPDNLLRIDDVVEIIFKCAKALHYAHSRGVIHRDIKPSNIMLTLDNDVRIIDFGIALVHGFRYLAHRGHRRLAQLHVARAGAVGRDHRASDIYSIWRGAYELLTGFRPFRADNLSKLLHQIVYATPPPIHTCGTTIPEELEASWRCALQKDPAKRCRTALRFAAT